MTNFQVLSLRMKKKVEPTLAQHLTGVLVKTAKNES